MDSPCVNVCVIDPKSRLCTGCARTLDEIAAWGTLSARDRHRIMAELPLRKAKTGAPRPRNRS